MCDSSDIGIRYDLPYTGCAYSFNDDIVNTTGFISLTSFQAERLQLTFDLPSCEYLLGYEAQVYIAFSKLQGHTIPKVYGLFVGHVYVLAMQYVGKAPTSLENLSKEQW